MTIKNILQDTLNQKVHNNKNNGMMRRTVNMLSITVLATCLLGATSHLQSASFIPLSDAELDTASLTLMAIPCAGLAYSKCDPKNKMSRAFLKTAVVGAGGYTLMHSFGNVLLKTVGDSTPLRAATTLTAAIALGFGVTKALFDYASTPTLTAQPLNPRLPEAPIADTVIVPIAPGNDLQATPNNQLALYNPLQIPAAPQVAQNNERQFSPNSNSLGALMQRQARSDDSAPSSPNTQPNAVLQVNSMFAYQVAAAQIASNDAASINSNSKEDDSDSNELFDSVNEPIRNTREQDNTDTTHTVIPAAAAQQENQRPELTHTQQPLRLGPIQAELEQPVLTVWNSIYDGFTQVDAQLSRTAEPQNNPLCALEACAESDNEEDGASASAHVEFDTVTITEALVTDLFAKTHDFFEKAQQRQLSSKKELEALAISLKDSWANILENINDFTPFETFAGQVEDNFKQCNLIGVPAVHDCLGFKNSDELTTQKLGHFDRIIKAMQFFIDNKESVEDAKKNFTFLQGACIQIYNNLEIAFNSKSITNDVFKNITRFTFFDDLRAYETARPSFEAILSIVRQASFLTRNEHGLALYKAFVKGDRFFEKTQLEYHSVLKKLNLTSESIKEFIRLILIIKADPSDANSITRELKLTQPH